MPTESTNFVHFQIKKPELFYGGYKTVPLEISGNKVAKWKKYYHTGSLARKSKLIGFHNKWAIVEILIPKEVYYKDKKKITKADPPKGKEEQLSLFGVVMPTKTFYYNSELHLLEFDEYDKFIVSFSGGKDSVNLILFLLALGIEKSKIEVWHQAIDGIGETSISYFDWPSTHGYVERFCKHFGLKLNYQWRAYGFFGEMFRENSLTNDVFYIRDNETVNLPTTKGNKSSRLKWPAKVADLNTRWCSAYLKIDVAARVLSNIDEFKDKKILFLTGERREESASRAKYKKTELHRTNTGNRLVHHFRPIIDYKEKDVWDYIEKAKIKPHPAYYLGFPRLSCRSCIFYSPDHWATLKEVSPGTIKMIAEIEELLGFTLDNKLSINEVIKLGNSRMKPENYKYIKEAVNSYSEGVTLDKWILPTGAFGKGGGAI